MAPKTCSLKSPTLAGFTWTICLLVVLETDNRGLFNTPPYAHCVTCMYVLLVHMHMECGLYSAILFIMLMQLSKKDLSIANANPMKFDKHVLKGFKAMKLGRSTALGNTLVIGIVWTDIDIFLYRYAAEYSLFPFVAYRLLLSSFLILNNRARPHW